MVTSRDRPMPARPQRPPDRAARRGRSAKISSGKEITRPVRRPVRRLARARAARVGSTATSSTSATSTTASAGRTVTEQALAQITDVGPARPRAARPGRHRRGGPGRARGDRDEIDQLIEASSRRATPPTAAATCSRGTRDRHGAVPALGGADAYAGDAAARSRARSAPACRSRSTQPGPSVLGNGQGAGDDGLLDVLRDDRRPPRAAAPAPSAARHRPRRARREPRRAARRCAPANGARSNRLDAAPVAARRVRGVDHRAAVRDRGRRHRQDDDRLRLPAGRLPGGPAGRGEHRPDLADGLPALMPDRRRRTRAMTVTIDSTRFGRSRSTPECRASSSRTA